ncbi:MAG: DUF2155 domain-containing protein [Caulobacter sp.]|nr:DUF2155 domain-containing protein [Caulobacter sp.]
MRLKLSLLAAVALVGAAGLVQAQQTPAPGAPAVAPGPATPEAEEAPPAPVAAPPPPAQPAPTAAEKPVTSATKPKAAAIEKPAEPTRRSRSGAAIIQAIDKVTAETLRFEAPIGQPIRYKTLVFTVRACETSAPDEATPDSAVYLTIDSQPKSLTGRAPPPPRQVFRGWMFASSPGLNPLQHPVYDAWLIACRASAPDSAKR